MNDRVNLNSLQPDLVRYPPQYVPYCLPTHSIVFKTISSFFLIIRVFCFRVQFYKNVILPVSRIFIVVGFVLKVDSIPHFITGNCRNAKAITMSIIFYINTVIVLQKTIVFIQLLLNQPFQQTKMQLMEIFFYTYLQIQKAIYCTFFFVCFC